MAEQYMWIVARCDSDQGDIGIEYMRGTENQIRRYLLKLAKADASSAPWWDCGPTKLSDIDKCVSSRNEITLNAENVFGDHHIDYTAVTTPLPVEASYVLALISDGTDAEIAPQIARDRSYL